MSAPGNGDSHESEFGIVGHEYAMHNPFVGLAIHFIEHHREGQADREIAQVIATLAVAEAVEHLAYVWSQIVKVEHRPAPRRAE